MIMELGMQPVIDPVIIQFLNEDVTKNMDELVELYKVYEEPPTLYQSNPEKDKKHFEKIAARIESVVFVAMYEGKIRGVITGYPLDQEDARHKVAFGDTYPPKTYHIKDLLVAEDSRRQKVATQLFMIFEAHIKKTEKFDQITVAETLRDEPSSSTAMWKKFGFEKGGLSKSKWIKPGETEPSEHQKQFWIKKIKDL